jgi:hypothetical protein
MAGARQAAPIAAVVTGLAPDDLLNIRAAASPSATIKGRLPNGASVMSFGCDTVNGYQWCKVEQAGNPDVNGWAPARYLQSIDADEALTATALPAPAGDGQMTTPADGPRPGGTGESGPLSLPDAKLAARLGGDDKTAPPPQAAANSPSAIGETAMSDAYSLALATQGEPSGTAPAAGVYDATAQIPCARYVGQPMTICGAGVKRTGPKQAEVTVTWPDGGSRVIDFRDGKPQGAEGGDELRYTREGSLNMIRIGASERFEITDALAFGD